MKWEVIINGWRMKVYMNIKSKSGVHNMLGSIEYKGYVERIPAHHRAIKIIKEVA